MEAGRLIMTARLSAPFRKRTQVMSRLEVTSLLMLFLMLGPSTAVPSAPVPRTSPEFTINEPSGKQILLSSFKGKVVMIEFFFLRSQKCINLAQTMNKLNAEYGARGFQPIAVAFPAPQSDANGPLVGYLVDNFKLTYPVGYTKKEDVDQYLSRGERELLRIPQVVIIDRAGMIRAQTGGHDGNLNLENEGFLRTMLEGLLKEGTPAGVTKK
jgi:peroxiredoxin